MRIYYFYQSPLKYVFLLLGVCLLVISSCKETEEAKEARVTKQLLPVSFNREFFKDVCPFEEILNYEEVPEKIRFEAETAMLKFMYPADIDRQIKFQKFRIHEKCEKPELSGAIPYPYSMHYIRHVDNEIISSVVIRLNFNMDQEYKSQIGLASGKKEDDPRYKNYISKTTLDSILRSHNFSNFVWVGTDYGSYGHQFLNVYKKRYGSRAEVNLNTGEFNSMEEWKKETATNFDLIPRYEGGESIPVQLEKHRQVIDSLLKDGQSPRFASEKLVKEGMQYLKDRKPKKAMSLLNLAYLVDSTNANVYWGFGRTLSTSINGFAFNPSKWYDIGFSLDSNNVNLLRSYAWHEQGTFGSNHLFSNSTKRDSVRYKENFPIWFKQVEDYFLKAIGMEPNHLGTINGLASFYEKHNRFEDAEEWYLKALAINQEDLNTLDNLVSMYLDLNDCKSAIAYNDMTKNLTDYCKRGCYISALKTKCGEI